MEDLNKVDLEEVRQKLHERLKESGWADKLKTFILSEEFMKILKSLHTQALSGKRFTPVMAQLFRAFEQCPFNDLKVVMIGQDPYPQIYVADGIAFSCSNTEKVEASLRYILGEVQRTIYTDTEYKPDKDLTRWANQGILMLNTSLTTTVGKIGEHYAIWQPFTAFLLDMLNHNKKDLAYVFLGAKAKEWSDFISDENNIKFFATHPASAAYKKSKTWDSENVFLKVSDYVKSKFDKQIIW